MLTLNQIENGRLTYEDNNGVSESNSALEKFECSLLILECHMCMFLTGWYCIRNWNR